MSKQVDSMSVLLEGDESRHMRTVAVRAYSQQQKSAVSENQITELLPMVHKIVHGVMASMNPPISHDDLVSAGMVGLVKASKDFSEGHKASFKTYAYIRIKGAVLDEIRSSCPLPTNVSHQVRDAMEMGRRLEHENGRMPNDQELARALGIEVEKLRELMGVARILTSVSIDDQSDSSPALANMIAEVRQMGPDNEIEKMELVEQLAKAIEQLPEKQRQTILLYYHKRLTMKEIAEVFEISEARVSQLHAGAIFSLSVKLRQWDERG